MAISDSPTYTNQQIVDHLRACLVQIALGGQAVGLNGKILTRANLADIEAVLQTFESRVSSESETGGLALVQYGERV